jgi:hypothetical protein
MKKIRQALRFLAVVFLLAVASFGAANILPVYRERFLDKEIRTEQAEKKKDDDPIE